MSLQGYGKCIRQDSCQAVTWTGHPESRFTFDLVADENVSQVMFQCFSASVAFYFYFLFLLPWNLIGVFAQTGEPLQSGWSAHG